MFWRFAAYAVHGLTALGALLGFQALIAAAAHRWEEAFAWLGIALIVDGVDGPLARRIGVLEKLPRFSGERLDLIIDYFTYVVVPAYIIYEAPLVPQSLAFLAAALILLTSLFHFMDSKSKTEDGFFVGFPAVWNIVALYLLIFPLPGGIAFAALVVLALLTFLPLKWLHPVRVARFRMVTFAVMAAWTGATVFALLEGFPSSLAVQIVIALSTLYLIGVGLIRSAE